jgi:glycosyltransferase involved in cell wall biosynthesis
MIERAQKFIKKFLASQSLFIPVSDGSVGGPNTFLANLRKYLESKNQRITDNIEEASIVFFPVAYPTGELDRARARGAKIVQRLDGVYYPSKHSQSQLTNNEIIKNIYLNYADYVVFQSEYSKQQCLKMLGVKTEQNSTVIVNGADRDIFKPKPKRSGSGPFKLITTGNIRNADMIEPVVKALDLLSTNYSFEFTVIGPVVKELAPLLKRSYINHIDSQPLVEIARQLQEHDLFIYSHLNPPCPNSVIEAITAGLPVAGFASGAMAELLYFNTNLLAPVSANLFQKYSQFDHEKLAKVLALAMDDYASHEELAAAHADDYLFEDCGAAYLQVFEKLLAS